MQPPRPSKFARTPKQGDERRAARIEEVFAVWREIISRHEAHHRMLDLLLAKESPDLQRIEVARTKLRNFEDRLLAVAGVGLDRLRNVYAPEVNAILAWFVAFVAAIFEDWDATEKTFSEYVAEWTDFKATEATLAKMMRTSSEKVRGAFESDNVALRRKEFGANKAAMLVAANVWEVSEKTVERHIKKASPIVFAIKRDEDGRLWSQQRSSRRRGK
jgi:hypothetical protein